jgi:hypothetical protein
MTMLAFSSAILLMGVRTCDLMGNTNLVKEGIKMLIFPTAIRLNRDNFVIKHAVNKGLKFMKILEDFRFVMK